MPTVYQRLAQFEKKSYGFKFPLRHKLNIGAFVKKEWNKIEADHVLFLEWSQEPEGTFHVPCYPEYFAPQMDEIIADYVARITAPKPKKISTKVVEKPPPPIPQKERKIRTRKPVPVFTTRKK